MDNDIFWTPALVEDRLLDAAEVMKRLPAVSVQGYFNCWPAIVYDFADLVGQEPPRLRRPLPPPDAISRMERTLEWLRWLDAEDAKLVWMRAERRPWKAVCCRFGFSRTTATRRHAFGLSLIAWKLNGRLVPHTWSREFLMERVRSLSSE